MEQKDLKLVLQWRNHIDIRRFMLTQHEIGLEEHTKWFEKVSTDPTRKLMIVEEGSEPLGFVQFSNVGVDGVSDWGFYVRPNAPKGSGRKLGTAALNHAFKVWKLHKVCGQAIAENLASIAFHQRLGFVQEGILREQSNISGKHSDLVCFGLLINEWK
ncbi:UDP-4-amino-4,6-dideoxy-N-acetyl-beta-L-altrosamine N-acetyltransferase [Comamonas sp.]|uniref:UDP-4-amino-4, 6-dideoxy-N-acetyl-beta-L-altrosamine N-acetyltransferase n=1 Tax=Comamonas sp. TaxID=34028 RepID=UPI003A8F0BC5